jgi:glycosyltransferase involved in cell wall biosynthesis
MRVLLLTTDAYGGHGGIALYNRDIADALAEMPQVSEIVVLTRTMPLAPVGIPDKVRFVQSAVGGKLRFVAKAIGAGLEKFDLVICGHVNLLPLAAMLNLKLRARLVLMVYGVDVWDPLSAWTRRCLRRVDAVWTISQITRDLMNQWAGLAVSKYVLLPNAIHLERYGAGDPPTALMERWGLAGHKVLLTLARLPSFERYKGIDEILELLPALRDVEPTLKYLIVGDGSDRPRLEAKMRSLELQDHVVFAGMIAEAEKADYFRMADAFAMPGRGEGFGFVFLEALACGIPAVGSRMDGSREALLEGELGVLVDPTDPYSVLQGIQTALSTAKGVPAGLAYFSWPRFRERLAGALQSLRIPIQDQQ